MAAIIARLPPFVAVAAFCVGARQNNDGTLSLDRIIDRVTIEPATPRPWRAPLTTVVALRCAPENRAHQLELQVRAPRTSARPLMSLAVETNVQSHSVARILHFEFEIGELGQYWFDVIWDGDHLTSIGLFTQTKAI